jgi:cobalt/nickel transport system permease protein
MHIASGFLSPPVWGALAAVSGGALAGALALSGRRLDERKVPLMGVMGAFVFAAQMVNFPIPLLPGTSGHLGGGFLLGVLLGPWIGLVAMASILVVQALVFQDGGVEALGANVFTMGIIPCLLGGMVRALWERRGGGWLAGGAAFLGAVLAVVLGAAATVLALWWSGSIPGRWTLGAAMGLMVGIHLVIGLVEGAVSVAVVRFVVAFRREAVLSLKEPASARKAA